MTGRSHAASDLMETQSPQFSPTGSKTDLLCHSRRCHSARGSIRSVSFHYPQSNNVVDSTDQLYFRADAPNFEVAVADYADPWQRYSKSSLLDSNSEAALLHCQVQQSSTENLTEEVNDWMRRRLTYFFMTPLQKFRAKRRPPCKLILQVLKVLVVTVQLILFAYNSSSHVTFGERAKLAFSHLYLMNWDPQYETLAYPPATGIFAVYTKEDFFTTMGYAIQRFNDTSNLSLGPYSFSSDVPSVTLCQLTAFSRFDKHSHTVERSENKTCIVILPSDVAREQLTGATAVEEFLAKQNMTFTFETLMHVKLNFELLAAVDQLTWTYITECYKFDITILFENADQSGQVGITLSAPFVATDCRLVLQGEDTPFVRFESPFRQRSNTTIGGSSTVTIILGSDVRRTVHTLIQTAALLLGLTSLVLCVRSIVRNYRLWKETTIFFQHWRDVKLTGVFTEFVSLWFPLMVVNDLLIIVGSLHELITMGRSTTRSDPISYVLGIAVVMSWCSVLRYVTFSYKNSLLLRTIYRSIPGLMNFSICALILFFSSSLCGWVVLGPYHIKFRSFMSTLECLFSLINGDDMYVTYSVIGTDSPISIYLFSRFFLYLFITLFIYVVLNLLLTIIFEAYKEVKNMQGTNGRPTDSPLWCFIQYHPCDPTSPLFKQDDNRPDRHMLQRLAQGQFTIPQLIISQADVHSVSSSVDPVLTGEEQHDDEDPPVVPTSTVTLDLDENILLR